MLFIPKAILTATKRHPSPSPRKVINTTVQKVLRSQDVPTSAVSLNRLSRSQPFILHSAQLLVQCSDSVVPYTNNHYPFPVFKRGTFSLRTATIFFKPSWAACSLTRASSTCSVDFFLLCITKQLAKKHIPTSMNPVTV